MTQTIPGPTFSSHKILARHHERLAVVYVRQSSLHQVQQNQESTSSDSSSPDSTGIECRQRLGGLLKHYRRMAA